MSQELERLRAALSGRYEVEREVGRGGMATVYLAHDVRHERRVALKVLRADLAAALGPERFLREIKIAATLQHPHILPLHDSGDADGLLFYVMPYVEGESLRERLARGGELPIPDAVRILRDVAEALDAAHERGVVHRDIKPDNVLLSGRHALVSDFGVAKALSDAAGTHDLTSAGIALGTPAYMAPEQAAGGAVDHRADIYAFGVMAYELLSGQQPFGGATAQAVLAAHMADEPVPLRTKRPTVPPELDAVVTQCLAKRAADRWQSARDLVVQLEGLATPQEGATPARAPATSTLRWRRRSVWAAALVAVLAAGALIVVTLQSNAQGGSDPRRIVVAPFTDLTGDSTLEGIGAYAADWIPRELERTLGEAVEVVPAATVRDAQRYGSPDSVPSVAELARLVGAGTVISGTARLLGNRIQVDAEMIDTRTGTLLEPVEPVSAARDSVETLIRSLAERVTLVVGARFSREFRRGQGRTPPSSLAGFREVEAGLADFARGQFHEALAHWYRAHELDSAWAKPLLHAWAAHFALGRADTLEMQRAESLLVAIGQREHLLAPADRAELMWKRGWMFGDLEAEYRAAETGFDLNPGGGGYGLGVSALKTNRPARAIEVMSRSDVTGNWMERWPAYWNVLASAHHDAGQLREALQATERARRVLPDARSLMQQEIAMRASLGQQSEVSALLDQAFTLPGSPISLVLTTARHYLAHGHPEAARAPLQRGLDWLESRPAEERERHRYDVARVLYWMERWEEALPLFEELAREAPKSFDRLGHLGVTLARLGRTDEALEIAERLRVLDVPYLLGRNTRWRAGIHAVLGDSADAVRLVRQAISEGTAYGAFHGLPEFEGLRSYGPYVELMQPRE